MRERVSEPIFGQGSYIGRITDFGFWIEERIWYRNSFKTRLVAVLADSTFGTRITCKCGMQPFVRAFTGLWIGGVALVLLFILATRPADAAVPLLMLIAGSGILGIGRLAARGEDQRLIDFVRSCLQADNDVPADGGRNSVSMSRG